MRARGKTLLSRVARIGVMKAVGSVMNVKTEPARAASPRARPPPLRIVGSQASIP
jgi:hypothetical protein